MKPAFLITIDTEGDNLWSSPARVTTHNSRFLPRFQALCERYGFKPTYLTDYDMARCPVFTDWALTLLGRQTAEIGAHLHPWNTPPIQPLTADDQACMPYATEYPAPLVAEKLAFLTRLLTDRFGTPLTSHRAGRWAIDGAYARTLVGQGYLVDCSVTSGFSWKPYRGNPGGNGGPDYTHAPKSPYFVDFDDVCRPGSSPLLELPFPMVSLAPRPVEFLRSRLPRESRPVYLLNRLWNPYSILRPSGKNLREMLRLLSRCLEQNGACVEFMLHSSELMPGGSPYFPGESAIEALYADLETLFSTAAPAFRGSTLTEFYHDLQPVPPQRSAPSLPQPPSPGPQPPRRAARA